MSTIESRFDEVLALSDKAFEPRTLQNARELIAFASANGLPPVELDEGYYATIRLFWPKLEIEVFDDHLETYPEGDGTRVRYEDHSPDTPFSGQLLEELRGTTRP